jgi:hypothetical protein
MGTFLDQRSSMNSNTIGAPNVPLSATPTLFGIIGLQTQNAPNTVIALDGMVGISGEIGDTFTVDIVRGSTFNPANIIFTLTGTVSVTGTTEVHSFTAQDLLAPPAAETVYTAYISGTTTAVRNGPEVFRGIASTA